MLSYELRPSSRFGLIGPMKQREKNNGFLVGLRVHNNIYHYSTSNPHEENVFTNLV